MVVLVNVPSLVMGGGLATSHKKSDSSIHKPTPTRITKHRFTITLYMGHVVFGDLIPFTLNYLERMPT